MGMMPEYYSSMYNGAMASFPPSHDPAAVWTASSRFQYYYPRKYEQMAYPLQQLMAAMNLDPRSAFHLGASRQLMTITSKTILLIKRLAWMITILI